MQIHYRKKGDGAEVIRLFSEGDTIWIPEYVDGLPVEEIAPYTFSDRKEREDTDVLIWEEEYQKCGVLREKLSIACGESIREIHLPSKVQRVGNYAFYGCRNLNLFHATDRLSYMGSGVFTGCRLRDVWIDFYEGEQSCLKEILTEIRYEIRAKLCYKKDNAGITAKVIFPEYYADAVENTPARIVETHYYGSGGDYRECFYRRELDYGKYDSMFILSRARDEEETTAELALARLLYPYKLGEKAKRCYQDYIKEHMAKLVRVWLERLREHSAAVIDYCCREHLFTEETMEAAVLTASECGQAEIAGILMEERRRICGRRKKTFEL